MPTKDWCAFYKSSDSQLIFVVLVRKHPYALFLALSTFPYFFFEKKKKTKTEKSKWQ